MTLHPINLNFLIYEENFILFFISVYFELCGGVPISSDETWWPGGARKTKVKLFATNDILIIAGEA
jgi:hypothetical protein